MGKNIREIERNKADRTVANERYFLLQMKLQNIEKGEAILKQLEFIHSNSTNMGGTDYEFIRIESDDCSIYGYIYQSKANLKYKKKAGTRQLSDSHRVPVFSWVQR